MIRILPSFYCWSASAVPAAFWFGFGSQLWLGIIGAVWFTARNAQLISQYPCFDRLDAAFREIAKLKGSVGNTDQPSNPVTKIFHDSPDLTVFALAYGNG
jgi:hypothetical protein